MIEIRRIDLDKTVELDEALALVGAVFDQFEAPEFSPQGIKTFHDSINPQSLRPRLAGHEMQMWVALIDEAIVGVIALRNVNHICMFFVDAQHHRQGIGRALYQTIRQHLLGLKYDFITVFSSPYAVPVYQRLGFVSVAEELLIEGMRCNPLCAYISKEGS